MSGRWDGVGNWEFFKLPESDDETVALQLSELDLFLTKIHVPDLEFFVSFVDA